MKDTQTISRSIRKRRTSSQSPGRYVSRRGAFYQSDGCSIIAAYLLTLLPLHHSQSQEREIP